MLQATSYRMVAVLGLALLLAAGIPAGSSAYAAGRLPQPPPNRPALIQPFQAVNGVLPRVSCGYGCGGHVDNPWNELYAIDFSMSNRSFPVVAAATGTLTWGTERGDNGLQANVAYILHTGGWITKYAHLASITVRGRALSQGEKVAVTQGESIGTSGNTGTNGGIHLHFELRAIYSSSNFASTNTATWSYPADDAINNRLNIKPNVPRLLVPSDMRQTSDRTVILLWEDTGDPDGGPQPKRVFDVEVFDANSTIIAALHAQPVTNWTITVPAEGAYSWHVRSDDGGGANNGKSGWSTLWRFIINRPINCPNRSKGDANCDTAIDLVDFELFRSEFVQQKRGTRVTNQADFNSDGSVDLLDFEIFRSGYLARHRSATSLLQASAASDADGSPIIAFFNSTEYLAEPGEIVDVDIILRSEPGLQVSGADIAIAYDSELLEYVEAPADYASPSCRASDGSYAFGNRFRVEHTADAGLISIARGAMGDDQQLPAGIFCVGTVRLKARSDLTQAATARMVLRADAGAAEIAGPQAPLSLRTEEMISAATIEVGLIKKPTNIRAENVAEDSLTLTWHDNANNEDGFRIYRWNGVSGEWEAHASVGPDTTEFSDLQLACGTSYFYQVKAFNAKGESASDDWIDTQTSACFGINAPRDLAAGAVTSSSVTLHWQDASDNEDGFNLYRWDGVLGAFQNIAAAQAGATEYIDTGLACGTSYFYDLRAFNGDGESGSAGWIEAKTSSCESGEIPPDQPAPPSNDPPLGQYTTYLALSLR